MIIQLYNEYFEVSCSRGALAQCLFDLLPFDGCHSRLSPVILQAQKYLNNKNFKSIIYWICRQIVYGFHFLEFKCFIRRCSYFAEHLSDLSCLYITACMCSQVARFNDCWLSELLFWSEMIYRVCSDQVYQPLRPNNCIWKITGVICMFRS